MNTQFMLLFQANSIVTLKHVGVNEKEKNQ